MKRLILIISTLLFGILSAVSLGEFYFTHQLGDPEYYILLFSLLCGFSGVIIGWTFRSKGINPRTIVLTVLLSIWSVEAFAQSAKPSEDKGTLDDLALFIAGMPQVRANSPFNSLEKSSSWLAHQKSMETHWQKLHNRRIGKMEAWYSSEFKHLFDPGLTMLYPFSGPDFVNAHTLYPKANRYIFFGLEDIADLPDIQKMSPSHQADVLSSIDFALRDIYSKGYFITMHMQTDLNQKRAEGIIPIFMVFMARSGHEFIDIEKFTVNIDGQIVLVEDFNNVPIKGLRIRFRDRESGNTQELLYFDFNVDNNHLLKTPGFPAFLRTIGRTNTFIKAASYLMCCSQFSESRSLVLEISETIFQDDTGIPLRYFDESVWALQLYGEYTWPTKDFGTYSHQPDLMKRYQETEAVLIKHLPFPMGYHSWGAQKQNHLIATRKY